MVLDISRKSIAQRAVAVAPTLSKLWRAKGAGGHDDAAKRRHGDVARPHEGRKPQGVDGRGIWVELVLLVWLVRLVEGLGRKA